MDPTLTSFVRTLRSLRRGHRFNTRVSSHTRDSCPGVSRGETTDGDSPSTHVSPTPTNSRTTIFARTRNLGVSEPEIRVLWDPPPPPYTSLLHSLPSLSSAIFYTIGRPTETPADSYVVRVVETFCHTLH